MSNYSKRQIWQDKLEFLLGEEAKTVDPAQKFKLLQDIAEAKTKLKELHDESDDRDDLILQVAPTRLRHGAEKLFGREEELYGLDQAWNDPAKHVLTIVAWGGVGKTSLVVEWMARQTVADWPGFKRVFDWSFYSRGVRQHGTMSADTFIAAALEFFGDEEGRRLSATPAPPWDKGAKLAQFIAQRRCLLVLDGLEPLQHPPGPLAGQIKDPALAALLRGLAQHNPGLCIVTTRQGISDLDSWMDKTVVYLGRKEREHDKYPQLSTLSTPAGIELLKQLGVTGHQLEFEALVSGVKGHALTLDLLGRYLTKAHLGDIRRRDRVKFQKADAEVEGGHAFRVIAAYERWLVSKEDFPRQLLSLFSMDKREARIRGKRQLAVLRLLGLFDRPADADCITALRDKPAVAGLTEPLTDLNEDDWNVALSSLVECGLISVRTDQSAIDAHPLIREYFAKQLRQKNPGGWRFAHRRLYEHLKKSTEAQPSTLEGLQPLYQAIAHGCQAGLHEKARKEVYVDRILRATDFNAFYTIKKLGAFGADLSAVACFFDQPWKQLAPGISEGGQAWLLNQAACCLRALGRLTEALEPMQEAVALAKNLKNPGYTASALGTLSELKLMLGRVSDAVDDAGESKHAADFGDPPGVPDLGSDASLVFAYSTGNIERMGVRTTLADALHQAGHRDEAWAFFEQAEELLNEQPKYKLLHSLPGFRYCDLLLTDAERTTWQLTLNPEFENRNPKLAEDYREVEKRAAKTIMWAEEENWLLSIALDHLTLGRVMLYYALLGGTDAHAALRPTSEVGLARSSVEGLIAARRLLTAAVHGLRRAGTMHHLPRSLLTRAWSSFAEATAHKVRKEHAQAAECEARAKVDLDEAWEIAERGSMKLFLADIHLHRARLFHLVNPYPWEGSQADLAAAEGLINECGYHRRDEELADAKRAILGRT